MITNAQYEDLKAKKLAILDELSFANYNFPHPLQVVGLSGSVSMVDDGRIGYIGGGTATEIITDIDYSLIDHYTRRVFDVYPKRNASPPLELDAGEFYMHQLFFRPWRVEFGTISNPETFSVGTKITNTYNRPDGSAPWTLLSTLTESLSGRFTLSLSQGGHPSSGGKDATGVEEQGILINIRIYHTPGVPVFNDMIGTKRLPWDPAWTSEADIFTEQINSWIAASPARRSGTCAVAIDFEV